MKEIKWILFIILPAFLFSSGGCISTPRNIISNADKTYSKMIHRVFVIVADLPKKNLYLRGETTLVSHKNFKRRMKLLNAFKLQMETEFRNIGIDSECYMITGFELDDSELENKISAFSPDAILYINCVAARYSKISMSSEYNVSFVDVPTERKFWRVYFILQHPSANEYADKLATAIFKTIYAQLQNDEMYILGTIEPLE